MSKRYTARYSKRLGNWTIYDTYEWDVGENGAVAQVLTSLDSDADAKLAKDIERGLEIIQLERDIESGKIEVRHSIFKKGEKKND